MTEQRCALITGGAQGIGKATAHRLLRHGWAVVIADINEAAGRETADAFAAIGPIHFAPTDVADDAQVAQTVAETVERFGGLDLLMNNAYQTLCGPPEKLSLASWNHVLGVLLHGAFYCARHAIPHLRARRGCIVNIASTRALMSDPGCEAYDAAKGALVSLTHALAMSLAPDIRVNCISPGLIETRDWRNSPKRTPEVVNKMHKAHPVGRVGLPEDVAALVHFLASPDAAFITGQNYVIDGGMTKKMIYV